MTPRPSSRLEVAQAVFDAYVRGDQAAMFELIDPDIVSTQFPEQVDVRPYHGHEGVVQVMANWIGTWDDYSIELLELREIGDCVVAALHQRGRGRGSGVAMEGDVWFVWRVGGGKLVRWQMFSTEREAIDATAEPYPGGN